jgi:chemotaxis protein MotB
VASRDRWLISYADFITLLFALFVVLYAISSVDMQRWKSLAGSVRNALQGGGGVLEGGRGTQIEGGFESSQTAPPGTELAVRLLQERLSEELGIDPDPQTAEPQPVSLRNDARGVVIAMAASDFFQPGSATLLPAARDEIARIAQALATSDQAIRIEGHTDDSPIPASDGAGAGITNNWQLSALRAASVAQELVSLHRISPSRIAVAGFADQRPRVPNLDAASRALNRRIELVLLAEAAPSAATGPDADAEARLRDLLEQLPPVEQRKSF